ncbi:hypothetical protein TWF506_009272 [Arthrobotrys conoides]|uniref:Uncharacterized protein n=1 Tax=Arthrobotrys conoides TaxID=74498 RepID=A0AAN8NI95_9PEZI
MYASKYEISNATNGSSSFYSHGYFGHLYQLHFAESLETASSFEVNPSLPRKDWIGRLTPAEEVLAHPSTDNTSPHHLDIVIFKIVRSYPATRRVYLTYMYNAFGAFASGDYYR